MWQLPEAPREAKLSRRESQTDLRPIATLNISQYLTLFDALTKRDKLELAAQLIYNI
ncbi:hypothetical protein [Laspinema olomoucense]|uniref:Uncharacterized protein n=1 Tax=Laspinema olomoucense D3b TaxID=2953688 RepID=A0ABT2N2H1_9CYAN|nr:hypothetical protein [Laspinema sp. D3b]MCT7976857.1 hypothetical protein [Laspinema sp. D3b]